MPTYLGIRHLSPNGAWNIIKKLEELKPKLVLIEGPSDFTPLIKEFNNKEVNPPIAILSYTIVEPIRSILYPFAEYSPEYQGIEWCNNNGVECRFMDLPSDVNLAFYKKEEEDALQDTESDDYNKNEYRAMDDIYYRLDKLTAFGGHENFWEGAIEHSQENYFEAVNEYGSQLRTITLENEEDTPQNKMRESYMKWQIEKAILEGYSPDDIVVIAGAYHIDGLKTTAKTMTKEEFEAIDKVEKKFTLMPYSYFKLSSQSGYGAGNKAPLYYHMLWDGVKSGSLEDVSYHYLSHLATEQRKLGNYASSAQIIDAVQLSKALAALGKRVYPTLKDLRDAAVTCFAEGNLNHIAKAITLTEIGTTIGKLPKGVSKTAIQEDFQNYIKRLKLEKYVSIINQEIRLDLRENIHVKSESLASIDLERSFFFHRLRVLDIHFVGLIEDKQENATWSEKWNLQWTTEVEIELVEASLLGDVLTKALEASMLMKLEKEISIENITLNIKNCFLCGMPKSLNQFVAILQSTAIDTVNIFSIAECLSHLSTIITFGDIRKINSENLHGILDQLYIRAVLIIMESSVCDDSVVTDMISSINSINDVSINFDFINASLWNRTLEDMSESLDINPFLSGFATSILLEKGIIKHDELYQIIEFRLSEGMDFSLAANWFEGLCMKNRYSLILNFKIWEKLDTYINALDENEFTRILVFLRRAFTRFNASEKNSIAENLEELWGIANVSQFVNSTLNESEIKKLEEIDDFDFDNI